MANQFADLSLRELTDVIASWSGSGGEGLRLYERLMDIAFMDHGISNAERDAAAQLASVFKREMMKGLEAKEYATLKTMTEEAIAFHDDYIARFGRGTVIWELDEAQLAAQRDSQRVSPELQDHLDKTSDTIAAMGFSVNYFVAEILRLMLERSIATPKEIETLFDRLGALMADEPNAVYKEKVEGMARMIRRVVLR